MFSWTEIALVVSIGVLVFGARKLPALGKSLRDSVIGFKKGIGGDGDTRPSRDVTPTPSKDETNTKS